MSKPLFDPAPIIAAYEAAYRAANGKEPPAISYKHGWFVFKPESASRYSYRRYHVEIFTNDLVHYARAREASNAR